MPDFGRRIGLFGYDELTKQTFYGLHAHLRLCWSAVIVDLAPANVLRITEELVQKWPRIAPAISQITERYRAKKVGVKDR